MDLTLDELSSVTSRSASDLKEALSTALFSSRGSHRLGWSHQTYSEFLAAKFLATTTSFDQQLELLTDKDSRKLIPQLQETGSWLASMSQPLRDYLIEKQPEKLLASMAVVLDPSFRKRLVERILELYQNKELPDSLLRDHYDKVCHPGLANQVKPFIVDGRGSYLVRRGAIEMAKACGLEVLGETLLTVALDPKEPEYTRICAADALLEVGKEEVRFQLLPLLYNSEEDPDDELRGYALAATWPGRLATNEMFDALNPPKNRNLWGSYRGFLVRELPARLKDEDLPLALDWLTTAKGWESFHEEETLTLAIVSRALESGEELTRDALAKLLVERVRSRGTGLTRKVKELLKHRLQENESLRRGLLTRIVPLLNGTDETMRFSWSGFHFANADDTEWMLEQLSQAPADKIPIWSRLIARRFDPTDDYQRQLVQTAARAHPSLWDEVKELLSPPPRDTEGDSGTRPARPEWRPVAPTPTPIMELAVKVVPAEPLNWIPVALALRDANCTTTRGALTASNIWASLTSETQSRIVEAAEVFVRNADPDTESWWGSNRYNSLVIEGVRALQLLLDQKPQIFSQLSAQIWDRWIPCLLTWGGDIVSNLLVLAYQNAPETTRKRVLEKAQCDAAHLGDVRITEYFNLLGDDELSDLLLHWLECTQVPDRAHVTVLSWLLTQGHDGSRARVTKALQATGADDERGRILSGLALARTAQSQDWTLIWDHIISVAALGHTFVERLIEGWHICAAQLVSRLGESQLGSLLEWMFQEFPPEQDAVPQGAHVVSTRQRIGRWRDQILESLQSRGTPEAAKALGKVAERFPERAWLGWKRDDAWENARSLMWRPLTPSEVMAVIRGAPRADGGGPVP